MVMAKNTGRVRPEERFLSVLVVHDATVFISMGIEGAEELGWELAVSCHDEWRALLVSLTMVV